MSHALTSLRPLQSQSLPLSRLISHCIDTGTFSSACKTAKATPTYKGQGSKDDKNNYRPISTPITSEQKKLRNMFTKPVQLHEKQQLVVHLAVQFPKILLDGDSVHSSDDQVSGLVFGLVFVDNKKAFDLIDHDILLSKLEAYGISSKEMMLLTNYLKGRKSSVVIGRVQSEYRLITHGVPQGSVLGPLCMLFIIFVNDFPNSFSQSTVHIYGDDTTLSTSTKVSDLPTPR